MIIVDLEEAEKYLENDRAMLIDTSKHDADLLDKVADSITEIYKCNLYCAEDYCDKEQCQNAEDCFYGAIVKAIERLKAEVQNGTY